MFRVSGGFQVEWLGGVLNAGGGIEHVTGIGQRVRQQVTGYYLGTYTVIRSATPSVYSHTP